MRPWTAVSFSTSAKFCRRSLARISFVSVTAMIVHCCTVLYVQLRYNSRVYPTPGQQASLARAFGCARVVFNDGLRARREARGEGLPYLSDAELSKRVTAAKATPERAWLGEVSAVVLQQALADLNVAYRNFFASITGKRKGRRV